MVKAIFFDIDGTLVSFKSHRIPDSTQKALHALHKKGCRLFIATGRPPCNITFLKELIDLDFDGYITLNGQYCFAGDTLLREEALPDGAVADILPYLKRENIACNFLTLDHDFLNLINDRVRDQAAMLKFENPESRLRDEAYTLAQKVYQLAPFICEDEEEEFLRHISGCKAARWHTDFTDIIPAGGGKPRGMDVMLAHFGLNLTESMAFGDGGNDMDMLVHASVGVAMGNAVEKIKAAADYVTDTVDDDGILKALIHFGIL